MKRAGIGAQKKNQDEYRSKFDDDEGRLGAKTIQGQLTKGDKQKAREEFKDALANEHLKSVVTIGRKRINYDDSDSDSDEDSKAKILTKNTSSKKKSADNILDVLFSHINPEIEKQAEQSEMKKLTNKEKRDAKKARKRQMLNTPDENSQSISDDANKIVSLSKIGGDAVVHMYNDTSNIGNDQQTETSQTTKNYPNNNEKLNNDISEKKKPSIDDQSEGKDEGDEDSEQETEYKKAIVETLKAQDNSKCSNNFKEPYKKTSEFTRNNSNVHSGKSNFIKKPFIKKEGTGSFRFAHLAPEERPTHDSSGKRLKYTADGRIKSSKRSKQKNIKKDNRPEHLKPKSFSSVEQ